jgi:ribosomal protein RSM22 (predicted rRNA methylase)
MHLPLALRDAIAARLSGVPARSLSVAAERLAERYRAPAVAAAPPEDEERLAYLAVRLPATFAATYAALAELRSRWNNFAPATVLDLGAGPGTATFAAAELWPALAMARLVEQDAAWLRVSRELAAAAYPGIEVDGRQGDLGRTPLGQADLVVAAYSLTELPLERAVPVLRRAWDAATSALVCVEPGTPEGFARIRGYRDELLAAGARLAAPCPHQHACPLPSGDWCHFAQRIERSSLHRFLKSGRLGYEDEKFSYLAAVRRELPVADTRILRRPAIEPGCVTLHLCGPNGVEVARIPHRDRERFKLARKSRWGGEWREPAR